MDKYNSNFSIDNLTLAQHQEMFKNVDINNLLQDTMPSYLKNPHDSFDDIKKENPMVDELKLVKSELQNQTKELEDIHYQNEKLNAQLKTANITIDVQSKKLNETNKLNAELNKEIFSLQKQLKESNMDKIKRRIGDIIFGGISGVITSILLYLIAKYCGIAF